MTRQEKESLLKHLDAVVPVQVIVGSDGKPANTGCLIADVKAAICDFVEDDIHPAGLNFEAEYKKLMEEHKKLDFEAKHWRAEAACTASELERARTVIKTIEFVTGRELTL